MRKRARKSLHVQVLVLLNVAIGKQMIATFYSLSSAFGASTQNFGRTKSTGLNHIGLDGLGDSSVFESLREI